MPPTYVFSMRDLIFYEYAKLISKSAKRWGDYKFVYGRYNSLKNGKIKMSTTLREWKKEQEKNENYCVYCSSKKNLSIDHIIPKKLGGTDSPDNLVLACKKCNSSKKDLSLFLWMSKHDKWPNIDLLDRILSGKYLKELYLIHEDKGTLNINRKNMLDYCIKCEIKDQCVKWKKKNTITPLCLEAIIFYQSVS